MSEPVFHGNTDRSAEHRHAHYALVYDSQVEQFATVVPFLRAGLDSGDRCIYLCDDNSREEIIAALQGAGVDAAAAIEDGQLTIEPAESVYLDGGTFDGDRMLDTLETYLDETEGDPSYERLRVSGENTWLCRCDAPVARFFEYEAAANHLCADRRFVGLCQFRRDRFDDEALADVLATHPQFAAGGEATVNDYYTEPETFQPGALSVDVDSALGRLAGQTDAGREQSPYRDILERFSTVADRVETAAEPRRAVTEPVVELLRELLSVPAVGLWRYEWESDAFTRTASASDGTVDPDALLDPFADPAWEAFVDSELRTCSDPGDSSAPTTALLVPIGDHGVAVAVSTGNAPFDGAGREAASTVGRMTKATLDHIRRTEQLADREQALERKADELNRLGELTELLGGVTSRLVTTRTTTDAQEVVCSAVADLDRVRFAWVGEYDRAQDRIDPAVRSGSGRGYLDAIPLSVTGDHDVPALRAVETASSEVVTDVVSGLHRDQWRQEALARGFDAVAAIPIAYDEVLHGVLAVYAADADTFDVRTRSALTDIADLLAYVFSAIERKHSLLTDRRVVLTFEFDGSRSPLIRLARRADCELELRGTVPQSPAVTLGYFSFRGQDGQTVLEQAADSVAVTDQRLLQSEGESGTLQLELKRPFVATTLAEHGAVLRSMRVDGDGGRIEVSFPGSVDTRAVAGAVSNALPDAELVSKRERDRPVADDETAGAVLSTLTDRQVEILRAAYHAGYFEEPRQSDGAEVAELLDISSPTFHQHRRLAINGILESVFGE